MEQSPLEERVASLERRLRRMRLVIASLTALAVAAPFVARKTTPPEVLRVRGIVVLDEQGRERIHIGPPVPDPAEGRRIAPSTGLVINDSAGAERFGLGLFPNGRL